MKRIRGRAAVSVGAVLAVTVAVCVGGAGAGAVPAQFYYAYAGGVYASLAGQVVTSDVSAPSTISGGGAQSDNANAAAATVSGLLHAGAVTTSTVATKVSGGYDITASASLANVNLLNGLVRLTALKSTTDVVLKDGSATVSSNSTFVGLQIAGHSLPKVIPQNFAVSIPGVATVALNYVTQATDKNGDVGVQAAGIVVTLLKPYGNNQQGLLLSVGPVIVNGTQTDVPPNSHGLDGMAYGTAVQANVGQLANVQSSPTAQVRVPFGGTDGNTQTEAVASVQLAPLARVGAVTTTAEGVNNPTTFDSQTTAKVAGINLFSGLIKADAVTADAHVSGANGQPTLVRGASGLVNLSIAGKPIAINVAPNTKINVLNLGVVTINQQVSTANAITVRAIDIVLSGAHYGLPAGAEVQVAVAYAAGA